MPRISPQSLIEQVHLTGRQDLLRKAESTLGLRGEALLVRALNALNASKQQDALLPLLQAVGFFSKRAEVQVLLVQTLLQLGHLDVARRVLADRLIQFPDNGTLLGFQGALDGKPLTATMTTATASTINVPGAAFEPPPRAAAYEPTVDVLLPVYQGREETLACLESLLRYRASNRTPHEIVVLDDASPDPELQQRLTQLAHAGHITYVRRPINLGFIGNVNRGMAIHPGRDVVWLNADTRVHGRWLDRLHQAAYSRPRVASVTPFTNNGLLMSVPEPLTCAPMPNDAEHTRLDQLAELLNQPPVEIPSGCGFCFYLRREAIDEVGYLDEAHLTRGYEEETDWCYRAHAKGWQHLGATNLYVAHRGGVSFGPEKALRVQQNGRIIRRRYPTAQARWKRSVVQDPLKTARDRLLQAVTANMPNDTPVTAKRLTVMSLSALLATQGASVWLIGDDLSSPSIRDRWLAVARTVIRHGLPCTLLLAEPTPFEVELTRTGAAYVVPKTRGITRDETLQICATQGCLCLGEPDPATAELAARNGIPCLRLQ